MRPVCSAAAAGGCETRKSATRKRSSLSSSASHSASLSAGRGGAEAHGREGDTVPSSPSAPPLPSGRGD